MSSMLPSISPELARIAPGFRALSINVIAAPIRDAQVGEIALKEACQAVINGQPTWAQAHIDAWNAVFKAFGAKPKRTPCSAEALRKRVLKDGTMAALDPVVDLYNAVSLRYAVPVGGENSAAYCGSPRLVFADGSETFDTLKEGQPVTESPEPGEVIWRDDRGVTCELLFVNQGTLTLTVNGRRFIIREGCSAVARTDMPHAYVNDTNEVLEFTMTVNEKSR